MNCLHGKPALSSKTKNGLFWFCGEKPTCEFFCPDECSYMFGRAVEAWKNSGLPQPRCHTHQRLAKMRVVKDQMKESYGRPYFVCADSNNACSFWQWRDVSDDSAPFCRHSLRCQTRKVVKEGKNKGRDFFCCAYSGDNSCGYFEWKMNDEPNKNYLTNCSMF